MTNMPPAGTFVNVFHPPIVGVREVMRLCWVNEDGTAAVQSLDWASPVIIPIYAVTTYSEESLRVLEAEYPDGKSLPLPSKV